MIRRIAILEPKDERLHLFSRYQLPRLGGVLLATILRDRGYEARAFFLSQREILTRELEREADLIAISSITATAPVAYALVDHYRCLGKRVVMGGPHVTFLREEALAHADFCILGEGGEPLDRGESPQNVPGLAWLTEGRLQLNPAADPLQDLDRLPFPDFTLLDSGGRKLGGPIGRATTRCSVDFALRKRLDSCQFMILTPFPGTTVFQRLKRENRILDYDWETYDGHHVKFQPLHFSPWELQKAQIVAHIRFFRLARVFRRLIAGNARAWVIGLHAHVISRRGLQDAGVADRGCGPGFLHVGLLHEGGFAVAVLVEHRGGQAGSEQGSIHFQSPPSRRSRRRTCVSSCSVRKRKARFTKGIRLFS